MKKARVDAVGRPRPAAGWAGWHTSDRLALLAVVWLFCLPLFVNLGASDFENDEAIYTFAVRSILQTSDWLTPKSSPNLDIAFLEKPPLKFWIVAAPIALGLLPDNEFGLRFWDALFGGLALLYVFATGRRIGGWITGAVAALILFVHPDLVFYHGLRTNNMEAALFLAFTGGVYHFIAWQDGGTSRGRYIHISMLAGCFVLGFMTKFVAIVFLPLVLGVVSLSAREGRARLMRDLKPILLAAAGATAAIAPWFLYQTYQFGDDVWRIMFGEHVVTRFSAYTDPNHLQPWHHYFTVMHEQLRESGTLFLVACGGLVVLAGTLRGRLRHGLLLLLWFGLPLTLISFGTSKLYHYAYPYLPPAALAGGLAVRLLWGILSRCANTLQRGAASAPDRIRKALTYTERAAVRWPAGTVAVVAAAIAVLTWLLGPLRLEWGGTTFLRNQSPVRPLLIAVAAAMLAGPARARLLAPILVLLLLPLPAYRQTLERLGSETDGLRTLGQCLAPISARQGGSPGPGVLVALPEAFRYHFFYQYFGPLGPWDQVERPSDSLVAASLGRGGTPRPILIWRPWFDEYAGRARTAHENTSGAALFQILELRPQVLMLLPGPFAKCDSRLKAPGDGD